MMIHEADVITARVDWLGWLAFMHIKFCSGSRCSAAGLC